MEKLKYIITLLLFTTFFTNFAQQVAPDKKIRLTGKVIEKTSKLPLEYATVTIENSTLKKVVTGGITDDKGKFSIDVPIGNYNIKIEFISFKTLEIKKELQENTDLGIVMIEDDTEQLDEVSIVMEKSTVEIKLDKKVYNVGQDMMVKGGTISDVLDNVPSVSVDVEGNVSMRGNDDVKILIDGKPSGMAGINIAEALRLLPADAVDKIEVITNPSARYDAEGGGGILNIILKKGKAQGVNGTFTATTGDPANHGVSGNINFRSENFNLFTTTGYNYRKGPGNSTNNSEYFDTNGNTTGFVDQKNNNERLRKSFNTNFGMEWFLTKSTTWTNTFSYRKSSGDNPENVTFQNFNPNHDYLFTRTRDNISSNESENVEFATNLMHRFKKEGHKLTVDASFSRNDDTDDVFISDRILKTNGITSFEKNLTDQLQRNNLIQIDYVLPVGEKSQFEAGYRGNFNELTTDYQANIKENEGDPFINDSRYSNILEYKEKVNAFYTQFGSKINKFSYLLGLRWEDSDIDINLITNKEYNNKKYNDFFPSIFFAYEFNESSSASISYSRRVSRPRSRFINPFMSNSSNINRFQGNPDLNPSFTDAFDLGYLQRWNQVTLNTSMYLNKTTDVFQFVRRESGEIIDGAAVVISSPINLATQYRFGFEFTVSYNPYKWWKLNGNFNFFRNQTEGDYSYINLQTGKEVYQNFDNTAYSWFSRITSKVNLPYGIDWQTNAMYMAPQKSAQGKSKGMIGVNLALSKDVLKDKGTIALNVNDLFNSRKRIMDNYLPTVTSHSEMQWRERQITLSFTYRFNKKKSERDRQQPSKDSDNDSENYMG